jgi:pimeloyl-ACP methyl ester carboxylesterase
MKYTLRLTIFLSSALLGLPIIVSATQVNSKPMNKSKTGSSKTRALDELVDVRDRRLYIKCMGKGSPTVILEAGLGGSSADWDKVTPAVGKFTRVCSYDRAGRGKSDPAPQPRTGQQIIDDLRTLLANAGESGPYVLVAHSFGGMYAILYANKYSTDIVGMVLVDSSHEDQTARYEAIMTPEQVKQSRERRAKNAEGVDTDAIREEVKAARWRTDIPLYVLVHGRVTPDMIPPGWSSAQMAIRQQVWREMQADLARRSSNSKMVIAEKSGHYIQDDQPELVIDAIKQVVVSARKNMKKAGRQK